MRAVLAALLALTAMQPVFAQNVAPTEDSVRHLLDLLQTHRVLDDAMNSMDDFMQKSMEQAHQMQGRALNAKQQQIIDQFRTDMVSAIKDELAWSKIEPEIVSAYVKTFTQKEINDMITFYSSPSGRRCLGYGWQLRGPVLSRPMSPAALHKTPVEILWTAPYLKPGRGTQSSLWVEPSQLGTAERKVGVSPPTSPVGPLCGVRC